LKINNLIWMNLNKTVNIDKKNKEK
jgi:hypothetical protein